MSFLVYRSSAGSGKTYTLVKEYLKIVLRKPDSFRNILAITFTNKAANEMKERLMLFLAALSKDPATQNQKIIDLSSSLCADCELSPPILRDRARRVLSLILHHYSDLAIGTIDSFVARIIRTFARDLHLSQSFEIELDQAALIEQSIESLLLQVGRDEKLTEALVEFILEKADDDKGWNIERDIAAFAKTLLFSEPNQLAMQSLAHLSLDDFSALRKRLAALRQAFEHSVISQAEYLNKLLNDNGLSADCFYQKKSGVPGNLLKLSQVRTLQEGMSPNSYVRKALEEEVWLGKTVSAAEQQAFARIGDEFKDRFRALHTLIERNTHSYLLYRKLYENLWAMSLIFELNKMLEEIKTENNLLPISEFNKRIAQVVLNEPIPFIYERLGERYHYFLIDEFQDTSILQWQNMLPLVENALSEGYKVIVVGDGKQSIYRWRGGEVEQFSNLPNIFQRPEGEMHEDREASLIRSYSEALLDTNYRSGSEIIQFNNEFFIMAADSLPPAYRTGIYQEHLIRQKALAGKQGGMVSIDFIAGKTEESSAEEKVFARVEDIIREVIEAGYQYGDIAILGRSNQKIKVTADFLISRGIPVQSPDMVRISSSGKVSFLLSCLRRIIDPDDKIAKRAIEVFVAEHGILTDIALDSAAFVRLPVYDLCETLIRSYSLAKEADPYLIFFLDAVNEYTGKYDVSVAGFLDWWVIQANKKSLLTPDEVPAVRLMTVHKAKGLQFPVVILPFLPGPVSFKDDYIWAAFSDPQIPDLQTVLLKMSKELENSAFHEEYLAEEKRMQLDYMNVLYVAMTRPEERLYLLSPMPSKTGDTFRMADFLLRYVKSRGYEDISQGLSFGDKTRKRALATKPEGEVTPYILKETYSSSWTEKLSIRFNFPASWDVLKPAGSRARGELLHTVMSRISHMDSVSEQIRAMTTEGIIPPESGDEIAGIVGKLLRHPQLSPFFMPGLEILSERDILLPNGQVQRPDRVICFPDRTVVLDFKTGERADHHLDQVRTYAHILEEMQYPAVEAYLVYLENDVAVVKAE